MKQMKKTKKMSANKMKTKKKVGESRRKRTKLKV